ncbi:sulfite exporter TauE/SafE family protein [Tepidibacillus marianensis]|uniref:sulfite exporter TauE/SafE family protein n=1 Tax=Tepidibacillus marianensis TaxID=3131995 RepID=UPI0030D4718B
MVWTALSILAISIIAGFFGSLLGLGGGIIVIPALTLLFHIDIRYAIGASIVSVIATSSGAAIVYVRDKMTNIRVGMFLELATTIGALTGAFIAGLIKAEVLYVLFGILMLYSAYTMIKKRNQELPQVSTPHPIAEKLRLNGEYYDMALNQQVKYNVTGVYGGFSMMYVAGTISGLLGIGSGSFKVIAMDTFMRLPMKISTATSNFMIGVTAAASASIYLMRGDIDPKIAGPVAIGVLIGSTLGTRIMQKLRSVTIRKIFIPVLIYVAIEMLLKGLGVTG